MNLNTCSEWNEETIKEQTEEERNEMIEEMLNTCCSDEERCELAKQLDATQINGIQTSKDMLISMIEELQSLK